MSEFAPLSVIGHDVIRNFCNQIYSAFCGKDCFQVTLCRLVDNVTDIPKTGRDFIQKTQEYCINFYKTILINFLSAIL